MAELAIEHRLQRLAGPVQTDLDGVAGGAERGRLFWLATDGPGPLSIDRVLMRRNEHPDGGRVTLASAPSRVTG